MNREEYERLWAASLQRPLTLEEESQLREAARELAAAALDWESDFHLNQLLRELPPRPVSSNFTAQVIGAVMSEDGRKEGWFLPAFQWPLRRWGYSAAGAAVVLALSGAAYFEHQSSVREQRAEFLTTISKTVPEVEVLEDFDEINKLSQAPDNSDFKRLISALK